MDAQDQMIIELVEKYPQLYHKGCADFKNKKMKENAWKSISEIVGKDVQYIEQRWTTLRNRFTSEKRDNLKASTSGSAANKRPPSILFKKMGFLEKFVQPRRTSGNIKYIDTKQENDIIQNQCTLQLLKHMQPKYEPEIEIIQESACSPESTESETRESTPVHHFEKASLIREEENKRKMKHYPTQLETQLAKSFDNFNNFLRHYKNPSTDDLDVEGSVGQTITLLLRGLPEDKKRKKIKKIFDVIFSEDD